MRLAHSLPLPVRSPLYGYESLLFFVHEAARPSNNVRVLELNEARAIAAAAIELGVSAEKLRALRVANVSIVEARPGLESSLRA